MFKALMLRNALALVILAGIAAAFGMIGARRLIDRDPVFTPRPAMTADQAAAGQSGLPTRFSETLAFLDVQIADATQAAETPGNSPLAWEEVAGVHIDRARLTGSFDDYLAAGRALDRAFAVAPAGAGPFLSRAALNIAVHRLDAVEPDLAAVERAVVPDKAQGAAALGLRGDVAFYRGRYDAAHDLYDRAHDRDPTIASAFRLAQYWARMGDEAKANRFLDEADSRVAAGPQQQQRAFFEMNRGILALDRGRWPEAQAHFARADRIYPGYWLIEQYLARVVGLNGQPERAMAMFQTIFERTGLPEPADAIAGLYRARGDRPQAEAWAAKAEALWNRRLAQIPTAAYGHALDHALAFGNPRKALAIATRNYAARPFAEAATGLAWAYMANGRPADAARVIAPVLATAWTAAEPYVVAAEAYALLGRSGEADAARRRALEINPHSFDRNPGMVWLEH